MVRCSVTKPANLPTYHQPLAEQKVLGAILVRPEVMDQLDSTVQPDDSYRKAHGKYLPGHSGLAPLLTPTNIHLFKHKHRC